MLRWGPNQLQVALITAGLSEISVCSMSTPAEENHGLLNTVVPLTKCKQAGNRAVGSDLYTQWRVPQP